MADGSNINTYMGNAALAQGGGYPGPYGVPEYKATLDMLDKVMYYNFIESKDKWARENLLADKAAEEAAAMFKFKMDDWLEGDTKVVHDYLNNFFATYSKNPDATRLRTKDGKLVNQDDYIALQKSYNDVNQSIAHAGGRKSTGDLARTKINAMPQGSPERDRAELWWADQLKQPFSADLVLPPDLATFDFKTMKPPTYGMTHSWNIPEQDQVAKLAIEGIPNIEAGANNEMITMSSDQGYAENGAHESLLTRFNDAIAQQHKLTPTLDGAALIAEMRKQPGAAETLAGFYDVYGGLQAQVNNYIDMSAYLKEEDKMKDIKLLDADGNPALTKRDVAKLMLASSATINPAYTLEPYTSEERRLQAQKDIAGMQIDAQKAIAQARQGDPKSMALGSLTAAASIAGTANNPGQQPVQFGGAAPTTDIFGKQISPDQNSGLSPDVRARLAGTNFDPNQNTMQELLPPGRDNSNTDVYEVPSTPYIDNIFRKKSPTVKTETKPTTVLDPDSPTGVSLVPGEAVTQSSYDRLGTWVLTDKAHDVDNNQYMSLYQNPDTKQVEKVIMNNKGLLLSATQVYDDGKASAADRANMDKWQNDFLRANNLPPTVLMSDLILLVSRISAAPVTPGGTISTSSSSTTTRTPVTTDAEDEQYKRKH